MRVRTENPTLAMHKQLKVNLVYCSVGEQGTFYHPKNEYSLAMIALALVWSFQS